MEGTTPFRFVGFNVPTFLFDVHWPLFTDDEATIQARNWEQEDTIKSLAAFPSPVLRTFVITTQGEFPPSYKYKDRRKHVTWNAGKIEFDEILFRDMDRALELANQHGVRLIVPLVMQNWEGEAIKVFGGVVGYEQAFQDGNRHPFYIDHLAKAEFKKMLYYLLNRQNKRTCVLYKDDPAILAWETGNELDEDPPEWTEEMARAIKCMDPNHLVMDGHYGIRGESLDESSAVDIVSNHYYGDHLNAGAVREDRRKSQGRKPFIVGEFGTNQGGDVTRVRDFLNAVVDSGTTGALYWELRSHSSHGGFIINCDSSTDLSCALHWPGFPSGASRYHHPNEKEFLSLIGDASSAIHGFPPGGDGRRGVPDPPQLISIDQYFLHDKGYDWGQIPRFELRWRGSAGADSYVIERGPTQDGPWTQLSMDASDNKPDGSILYHDAAFFTGPRFGQRYYYRVSAQFIRGFGQRDRSTPSKPFPSPVASCLGPWSDEELCESKCGQTVVDPCEVSHRCPACPPCFGEKPCLDNTCPSDHGGTCPEDKDLPCLGGWVRCPDGSCAKSAVLCGG